MPPSATGGISILAGRPVTALLAHSLPWLALVVVIAIVAAVAGVALRARFRPGRVPNWMVGYAVSSVAFLAGLSLLVGWRDAPGDFFLTTATSASDYPLVLGARRLLVLGYPVGAVALSGGALVAVDERSTAARARAETVA